MLTFAIPTWNRAAYLTKCLDSIIYAAEQVDQPIYIRVFDNCSTDHTPAVLREFKKRYPAIVDYRRGETHLDYAHSFQQAFTGITTEWTWMMGDDDLLVAAELPIILSLLENDRYDFVHVAEKKRVGTTRAVYPSATMMELANVIGFLELTGFISCNICRSTALTQGFTSANYEIYAESSYAQSLAMLEVLANRPCAYVDLALIELQNEEQTPDTLAQWEKNGTVRKFGLVGKGLRLLADKGVIPQQLTCTFFRYLTSSLFSKVLFAYWADINRTHAQIPNEEWAILYDMSTFLPAEKQEAVIAAIREYRSKTDRYLELLNESNCLLPEIDAAWKKTSPETYQFTYL